ncbi:hypothetical protein BAE44_0016137 [Dichanthelium oligosanthes]|uniref:Uncharacterized protein n=1 Tax=Dichanthelium oligosanthes TaxID=888268 RepID=A0A1E5VCW2_9POAL|nr:hypothetical protein BAE44_0016137 [Dichanthelium oligosanthes]
MSTVETVQGTHSFKITCYSLHKQLSIDKCFCSAIFAVGGHNCAFATTPRDMIPKMNVSRSFSSSQESFEFRMVKPKTGLSYSRNSYARMVFNGANLPRVHRVLEEEA